MILLFGFWGFFITAVIEHALYFYYKYPTPDKNKNFFYYFRPIPLFSASYIRGSVPESKMVYFEFLVKVRIVFAAVFVLGFLIGSRFSQN